MATLIQDIEQAVNGEYHAIHYYSKLAQLATSDEDKEMIQEIRNDEKKHYRTFYNLYVTLTGAQPRITKGPTPPSFEEGLIFAIKDELETVDFYLSIYDKARDPSIRKKFKRAALDEQQHASSFQFMWTKFLHGND